MISILLLEDNDVILERLRNTLQDWHYCAEIFESKSNQDAIKIIKNHNVDLLLADLNVADGDGTKTIRKLSQSNPNAVTIVISALSQPERIIQAIKSGAIGYLHKSDTSLHLIGSIEKALGGHSPISAEIAIVLCKSLQDTEKKSKKATTNSILTDREMEVIHLIARGLSYSEISDNLSISKNTLPVHVRNIYRKLQTNNRSEAVFEARNLGILE